MSKYILNDEIGNTPTMVKGLTVVGDESGKLEDAIKTLRDRNLKGTVILFCNFWNERKDIEKIVGDFEYSYAKRIIF